MKIKSLITATALLISAVAYGQTYDELKAENAQLKQQNALLLQMLSNNMQGQQNQQTQPQDDQTSMFGKAIQRSRVEEAAMTATGSDIRGYGREQSAKSSFARNKAENQARMELARQIEAYARYALNQYNEETTAGGQAGLDSNDQESAITAAKNVIEGAKILDAQEYYDANNKMYTWEVCVVYDRAGLYSVMEEQSARIKKNKAKFEKDMQKYFDEMDHMQGRMTEAEKAQGMKDVMNDAKLDNQHQRDMERNGQYYDYKLEKEKIRHGN